VEQVAGLEAQRRELKAAGCEEPLFEEQVSSVAVRTKLQEALRFARKGDTFVVTKIDRLARSIVDLMTIIQELKKKEVRVRILNLGMDTGTPTGKLILTVLGGIAQFKREIMLERQREGIAKAKAEGKYKGRKPHASETVENVLKLDRAGIDRAAAVYRILAKQKAEAA
jgi:DNA invertase Pin-like site-specific DNA recombinase